MLSNYSRFFLFCGVFAALMACEEKKMKFKLIPPSETGIQFVNQLTPTKDLNILTYLYYYNGAGVTVADFNNDGLNDIYFTSNQGADKLFINQGDFKFLDATNAAGIENTDGWTTGVTHVDLNGDGLLDIYVCKVGSYKEIKGSNLLFVNQGVNAQNIPVFKELSHDYGLDHAGFSTQAAFFDYDVDGDLDMYLLAHSVHPNHSYGHGGKRSEFDSLAGDRLFRNDNGVFKDVSQEAGLFQGKIGYGLGLAIGDVNCDGYPDIYVGNDFFENDYLYQNNGDGTFTELNSKDPRILGHTTHYSMGNSIVDVNNDGLVDILSLDMLPENIETLKTSGLEDGYSIYDRYLKNGYTPQFMQNTLHINRGGNIFSEVGFQSGIAATEWSWGILAADFDMDGLRDIYVTNGILGATNDLDYVNFISQDLIQKAVGQKRDGMSLEFSKHIPEKRIKNYAFKNVGNASFVNVTDQWFDVGPSLSNGSVCADLDNDGDLDLVVNNVNDNAFVFRNWTNEAGDKNYLKLKFVGPSGNSRGIGAKVEIHAGSLSIYEENYPVKSYLSTIPDEIVIGLDEMLLVDSIVVVWPGGKSQKLVSIKANQTIEIQYDKATEKPVTTKSEKSVLYLSNAELPIEFAHQEETTLDFDRDPLVPFAVSNEGPCLAIADINGDLLDDIFIGGAKLQPSQLFVQDVNGSFQLIQQELFYASATSEDVDQLFFDADQDGDADLLIVSGGNEFKAGDPIKPRLYINVSGMFEYRNKEFQEISVNASVVRSVDIENDGDLDIIIGSDALPGEFGEDAVNYIFRNDGAGHFEDITYEVGLEFRDSGLVTDISIGDFDNNGFSDFVAVGTWTPVIIYFNDGKHFRPKILENTEGWWKSAVVSDFDKDGDLDIIVGNWGMNTRMSASPAKPIRLYRNDFDGNGDVETLITYYFNGIETFLSSKDELGKRMPFIMKKYPTYREYAKASIEEVVGRKKLEEATLKQAKVLSTSYFENDGKNNFSLRVLPGSTQNSSVNAIAVDDFNEDGYWDVLMVGNNYEISTQLGRLDASHGVLLLNDRKGFFNEVNNQTFNVAGPARDIKKLRVGDDVYYAIAINNDRPVFLKKQKIRK